MKKMLSMLLVSALIFTSCSGSKPETTTETNNNNKENNKTEQGSPAQQEYKTSITWAQGSDVFSMDPHIGKETTAIQVTGNIYDTLLTVDSDMNILPSLATKWEQTSELTYEFTIRNDAKFHDGSMFTVEDAKFSVERALNSPQVAYIVDFIEKVDIKDENTIIITTKAPYAPTYLNLTHPAAGMVSKAYCESDPEILKTKPMGTGAFKFVEWKQGDYVKLEANEDYWGGAPVTKNLTMRIIPENAQRTIALEMGEVDLAYDILPNDIKKVQEAPELQLLELAALTSYTIGINHTKPNLDDAKVRQAMRYVIKPQDIVDSILYGAGSVADSMVPPAAFGYQPDLNIHTYDVEKAKALLAEAGIPDGFKTSIVVNDNQTRIEICQVIQSQLKSIGIDCEVKVLEFGAFIDFINAGNHDMCLSGWTTSTADADYTYFAQFHSSKMGSQGNRVMKNIPGADALLEAGRASSDPNERLKIYSDLEKILTEECVNIPLVYTTVNVGASKKIANFEVIPNGYHKYHKVTLSK